MRQNRLGRWALVSLISVGLLLGVYEVVHATNPPEGMTHSFYGSSAVAPTANDVRALIVLDLDNDAYGDLAYADGPALHVARNNRAAATSWPVSMSIASLSSPIVDLAWGDIDFDGRVDLVAVTAGEGGSQLVIWRNPTAPFTNSWSISNTLASSLPFSLTKVAAADLDRNGKLDIVAAGDDGTVYLLANPGTSPFTTSWGSPAAVTFGGESVAALAVADVDRDGLLDIVAGVGDEVQIRRNPGAPFTTAWATSKTVGVLDQDVSSLAVGDLDGDGQLDLAAGHAAGHVLAWRNPGTPFTTAWDSVVALWSSGAAAVHDLALADLDNDSDLDLAGAIGTGVLTWQNDGTPFDGGWAARTLGSSVDTVYRIVAVDPDQDGDQDVISVGAAGAPFEVLLWHNTLIHRQMAFVTNQTAFVAGTQACRFRSMVKADLDGDGDLDLATACDGLAGYRLLLWENDGSPFVDGWTPTALTVLSPIRSLSVADLDRDGMPDLVTGHENSSRLVVWRNDSTPFLGAWVTNTVGTPAVQVRGVATGDFDRDGYVDIVSVLGDTDQSYRNDKYRIHVWRNDGSPFTGSWSSNEVYVPSYSMNTVAVGDLDNDGWLDLVVGLGRSVGLGTYLNPVPPEQWYDNYYQLRAYRNDGTPYTGQWTQAYVGRDAELVTLAPTSTRWHGYWGGSLYDISLVDLDRDGMLDIATVDDIETDYQVKVWRNDGTPWDNQPASDEECRARPYIWQPTAVWVGSPAPWMSASGYGIDAADMNLDGIVDLVTVSGQYEYYETNVWANSGRPFGAVVTDTTWVRYRLGQYTASLGALSVSTGDFDQDGDPDIAHGSGFYNTAGTSHNLLLWNNPSGSAGISASSTAVAQFPQAATDDLLRLLVTHQGVASDHNAEVAALRVRLSTTAGAPLTTSQAQALIQNLYVYHSTDATWTAADSLLATVSQSALSLTPEGVQSVSLPSGNPLLQLTPGASRYLFVVVQATANASFQSPNSIVVKLDPDVDVRMQDSTTGAVLSIRDTDPVSTPLITFVGPATRVLIMDAPTVGASEVMAASLGTGEHLTVYSNSYDAAGNFLQNLPVTWSLTGIVGNVTGSDLAPATDSRSATFTAHRIGAARILADHATLLDDTTGLITVTLEVTVDHNPASAGPYGGAIITATLVNTDLSPVADGTVVTFTTSLGSFGGQAQVTRTTTGGVATATLTSSTVGSAAVTAASGDVTGSLQVEFVSAPPAVLVLGAEPASIPADGIATARLSAAVTDALGYPVVDGTVVTFTTSLGSFPTAPYVTLTIGGIASATLTSPTTLGTATVHAAAGAAEDDIQVTFTAGTAATLVLTVHPTSLPANGVATAVVTATVTDAFGNAVADGTAVVFSTSLGSFPSSPYTAYTSGGVARATLTSSTAAGTATVHAAAGAAEDDIQVTFTAGTAGTLVLTVHPTSLPANGVATAVVTATVTDAFGNRVADGTAVVFSTSLGSFPSSPYTAYTSGGVATATLRAPSVAGFATVEATSGNAVDSIQVEFTEPTTFFIYLPLLLDKHPSSVPGS